MDNVVHTGCVMHPYNKRLSRSWNIYDRGDFAELELTQNMTTIFDLEDIAVVKDIVWRFHKSRENGYAVSGKESLLFLHNHITKLPCNTIFTVDHKNQIGLDNRRKNLRLATKKQQEFNKIIAGISGFRGVSLHKGTGRYRARVTDKMGNLISLGYFNDPTRAAEVWDGWMYDEFKEHNPLEGIVCNGVTGEPTLNFMHFNFPERLGL